MKIAICFFGLAGSVSDKNGNGIPLDPSIAYKYYKENIFDKNDEVDIFIHSCSLSVKERLIELYKPKKFIIERQVLFPNSKYHPYLTKGLIRRFHEAVAANDESILIWGTGKSLREFLHVDDLAAAAIHLMNIDKKDYIKSTAPQQSHINVGSGVDLKISELVTMIAKITGFTGTIHYDTSMPDGAPRKLMDITLINSLGWQQNIDLEEGLQATYRWYQANIL